jgi:hypothetical protein
MSSLLTLGSFRFTHETLPGWHHIFPVSWIAMLAWHGKNHHGSDLSNNANRSSEVTQTVWGYAEGRHADIRRIVQVMGREWHQNTEEKDSTVFFS